MPSASVSILDLEDTMTTALPKHVIDFKDQALAPLEPEINDPVLVDAPYRSVTWRHFN
jgi:hypothetical protein